MAESTEIERADRASFRRARMFRVIAVLFVTQQIIFLSRYGGKVQEAVRSVDELRLASWIVLSIVILAALTTGGAWFQPARVRALMNDEVTLANRADAFRIGFLVTMIGGILLYLVDAFEPLSGRTAIHILLSIGLGSALLRFARLEQRDHRNG